MYAPSKKCLIVRVHRTALYQLKYLWETSDASLNTIGLIRQIADNLYALHVEKYSFINN